MLLQTQLTPTSQCLLSVTQQEARVLTLIHGQEPAHQAHLSAHPHSTHLAYRQPQSMLLQERKPTAPQCL